MLIFVTAVAVVLVASFLCSIFESVLLSLSRSQVEMLGRKHESAARLMADFKQNIDVPIAAILILNTAAHTIGAAVAGASYSSVFDPGTLWVFSILFTLAVLVFTEIIPKTLGVSYASALAAPVAHGIRWLTIVLRPLVWLSERLSRSLRGDVEVPVTSTDEIRLLATLGRSEGAVGARTAELILGATQIRHLQAHDVMLPRTEVRFLSTKMGRSAALQYIGESGHSRFPLSTTEDLSEVIGIVLAKDLYCWLLAHDGEHIDWEAVMKEPIVVPENLQLPRLLRTFQEQHRHLAIVVDEYGNVEGIATLEDVMEEIVGDIRDEFDFPVNDIQALPGGPLLVRGNVDLRRLSGKLGITWEPDIDVASVGGLVTEILERIPIAGDSITWNGYKIEVIRADRRRAKLLRVTEIS